MTDERGLVTLNLGEIYNNVIITPDHAVLIQSPKVRRILGS
jgi:hypothetical protein